ncbi:DUF2490 domain-containing protein [Psychroserpens algicola]|uniref:DUF2490 domain-containing protein n=1 Tax=Psychroserpens algicola TaxID=1719034 RepID=A0ABT0H4F9_9FLAO|nr:DUF2490 domain-containing protein [Psychroserpens algicola]MCK8479243.1 DUF2490 domain-containing protein [Psychroserpens algicola]
MNISCTRLLVVLFVFVSISTKAQDHTEVFHEHEFNFRHSFSQKYSANFGLSSRAYVYTNEDVLYNLRQVQISHFSTLKLDLKHSIALGLMYRNRDAFENSSNEIRVTQQFNRKSLFKTLRVGHRLRSEQRFYDSFTAFRFRYRLALDIPLQGLKLDVGETYFVVTNEGLLTSSKVHKPELEYRISPSIGILLSEALNIEFGVELRLDQLNINTEDSLFFNTSVDIKI